MKGFSSTLKELFADRRVVIAGDAVADQFLLGTIERISREAPVFILRHDETTTLPGGAANAAANVASLGGHPILIGVTGRDDHGEKLRASLAEAGVGCEMLVSSDNVTTTTKTRVLAGQYYASRQQVVRIDYEKRGELGVDVRHQLRANLMTAAEDADAIIVSDYNYGVADIELFTTAREIARRRDIPLLIDSRFRLGDFAGATTATPNSDEVEQVLGKQFSAEDCDGLRKQLGLESMLVTCGNKGVLLTERNQPPLAIKAVGSDVPVDVTGAGDTVIAAFALSLAAGLSCADAARMANHAGGIVVMKKGTATVSIEELGRSLATEDVLSYGAEQ